MLRRKRISLAARNELGGEMRARARVSSRASGFNLIYEKLVKISNYAGGEIRKESPNRIITLLIIRYSTPLTGDEVMTRARVYFLQLQLRLGFSAAGGEPSNSPASYPRAEPSRE